MAREKSINYDAFESLAVAGSAVGFTAGTIGGNRTHALITCETAAVRFRFDGTDPTSSVGHLLEKGDIMVCESQQQVTNIRFIRKTGQSATLQCSYGL